MNSVVYIAGGLLGGTIVYYTVISPPKASALYTYAESDTMKVDMTEGGNAEPVVCPDNLGTSNADCVCEGGDGYQYKYAGVIGDFGTFYTCKEKDSYPEESGLERVYE